MVSWAYVLAWHGFLGLCVDRIKMLCQTGETTGFVRTFKVAGWLEGLEGLEGLESLESLRI